MKKVLVVSPTPSHPTDQGNSARIAGFCKALSEQGCFVTFLYVGMERDDNLALSEMKRNHDDFLFLKVSRQQRFTRADGMAIDDWYQTEIDLYLHQLFRTREFDMMIVNYVWFSKAFDSAPPACLKVLDTHDIFSARAERLHTIGIKPQWFYTTEAEEVRGFNRADVIIAIQDEEASFIRQRVTRKVLTIGHMATAHFLDARHSNQTVFGILASGNPLNVKALNALSKALKSHPESFHVIVAGKVCENEDLDGDPFDLVGYKDDPLSFYGAVDIVINPHIGGTGLKIKSVEALSYGRALLATRDAMLGLDPVAEFHRCKTLVSLVSYMSWSVTRKAECSAASRSLFLEYQNRNRSQITRLAEDPNA